ncbi:glycosyltransferase family 4 protein [Tautonia plasticadhaerens]|uniref:Alpha-D-kanosaminyltransferase n=1 Tax=Tautonia plasticadhaerens TaxID=2527974 RepID=A0A518HCE8_9BACT|nr:glycosyltransferase family 4 protein [Tautonia plasticadhaerens]QDV38517.1 Alpha-D-kanosaminyltransferase [Tautonia plasticadhaerens]
MTQASASTSARPTGPGGPADAVPEVAIVAQHASLEFGGEAALPFHFFRVLRKRGVGARLVVHERCRDAVAGAFPDDLDRVVFVPDRAIHRLLWRVGSVLPGRVAAMTTDTLLTLVTQWQLRRAARDLIRDHGVGLVHQPIPVSPKAPSLIGGLGVPVIIGPMNGGMDFPDAFRGYDGAATRLLYQVGRRASWLAHRLIPGKLRADALLVANRRTALALPSGARGEVIELVENGVDLDVWDAPDDPRPDSDRDGLPRFAFLGRLVDWKAVDLLLEAFARVVAQAPALLEILGDGPMRPSLEEKARGLGLIGGDGPDRVEFLGWQPQAECSRRLSRADALVLPSLYECGGAVVLEAMAMARPVVATDWGGPADYLDPSCGILVPPDSREGFVSGLASAMLRLAGDPDLRRRMGAAGRRKVVDQYAWDRKAEAILAIYARVASRAPGRPVG